MRHHRSDCLLLSLLLAGACASANSGPASPRTAPREGLQIKQATVFVDDQEKALRFYTDVLGFAKKDDVTRAGYRWLSVAARGDADGGELQLAKNDNPAAKAFQQAMCAQGQPAIMFYTDDVQGDYERIKARGAEFVMPPTDVTFATIAILKDTCGNLVQIAQLDR
jgi:predicted enzyme related to lactoylglutathione lyase